MHGKSSFSFLFPFIGTVVIGKVERKGGGWDLSSFEKDSAALTSAGLIHDNFLLSKAESHCACEKRALEKAQSHCRVINKTTSPAWLRKKCHPQTIARTTTKAHKTHHFRRSHLSNDPNQRPCRKDSPKNGRRTREWSHNECDLKILIARRSRKPILVIAKGRCVR